MKKIVLVSCLLLGSVFATDFSGMSLDEMKNLRGSVPEADREAFRTEMQKRVQNMTPAERDEMRSSKSNGKRMQLRDGSGSGNMYKGSGGGMGKR